MRGFWTGLLGTNESHLSVELTMYSFNPKYKFLPHRDLDRTDILQYLISRSCPWDNVVALTKNYIHQENPACK